MIFGIGLSRTGTRSLAKALTILGYRTVHYPWSMKEIVDSDAALDIPVACRFQMLDESHPGSKFILTTRPYEDWISSCKRHPKDRRPPPPWKTENRVLMYGTSDFPPTESNTDLFKKAFDEHHARVYNHFANRPNDLLVLELGADNKWETLCAFLDKEIPETPYPTLGKRWFLL